MMRFLCFPFLVILLLGEYKLPAQDCLPFEEIHLLQQMPEPVSNNAVCGGYVGQEPYIYSFGGIDSTKSDSGIHLKSWKYSISNDNWTALPNLPDTMGKIAASASYIDGIIYIVGGYHVFPNGSEVSSLLVHRFDCENDTFLADAAPLPIPIDDQVQAVWRDSLLFVMTGWSNTGNVTQLQVYNPTTNTWNNQLQLLTNSIYGSFGSNGIIVEDTIYYLGGHSFGTGFSVQPYLRKGMIDPANILNINWSHDTVGIDTTLYRPAAFNFYGTPTWIGGSGNSYNYDGIAYDGSGGVDPAMSIVQVQPNDLSVYQCTYANMDLRGAAWFPERGELYITGGMTINQQVTDKITRFRATPMSVKNSFPKEGRMRVYPNPSSGIVNLFSKHTVHVIGLQGVLIQSLAPGKHQLDLQSGIYFISNQNGHESPWQKIIVARP